ncbi:MAG TPA: hypothetical protein VF223_15650 [Trebonia sp.]
MPSDPGLGLLAAVVGRYGHWILPAALILIGLYVLRETNAPIGL